ncbi:MAG TPA: rhodanese-like domain-containing protein [Candidatus Nitrosopolaris sp.]|nr:rhodanese-like domain-containing protein [Candidatus Nitrosopolaris sp.]
MKDDSIQSLAPGRQPAVKWVLLEAVLVVVFGALFAVAANRVSPRGLALTRNFFPEGTGRLVSATPPAAPAHDVTNTHFPAIDPAQIVAAKLREKGLQLIDRSQAVQLFHDPRFQQNTVVFVDARDEQHYREGHIPGAYEFDPYRPEKYFDAVLPVCKAAEQIVVYCNGGDCDDSETAALLLRDVGIANQKLVVYGGGITEWTTDGLPVETGGRNSANPRNPGK